MAPVSTLDSESTLLDFVNKQELQQLVKDISVTPFSLIKQKRQELFTAINGDLFFPLSDWPVEYRKLFWEKPISDSACLKLFLFMVANGCAPQVVASWILISQYWNVKVLHKRYFQLFYIMSHFESNRNMWFYFDIRNSVHRYLSGALRSWTA